MKIKKIALTVSMATTLTISPYSQADSPSDFELGVSDSRGNSDSTAVNAQLDLNIDADNWRHKIFGQFYYAKSGSKRTAENCFIGYKPSYFLSTHNYLFSFLRYGQDEYASFEHRTTGVAGYGRQLVSTDKLNIDAELGLGARQTIYAPHSNTSGLSQDELIYFLGGEFTSYISKTSRITETVRVEGGQDNTYVTSITSLRLAIEGNLSAKISYIARYNTDVTGDNGKKVDTLSTVNLVYNF